jgi:hypothetical protein
VRNTVKDYLSSGGIDLLDGDITVSPDPATAAFGEPITVSLSVDFKDVSWLPAPMYLKEVEMAASSVMRRESVQ